MRILLARHGETPWNAEGRYQGQIDIPLSPVGEAQARALGERLHSLDITRAVASPLSRAQSTARAALGSARESMLQTDADLQEFASRADELCATGNNIIVSNFRRNNHLAEFISNFKPKNIGIATNVYNLKNIFFLYKK